VLADELASMRIEQPVFISGIARSGSTVLLEILAQHPEVATHRYRDFPMLYTPYWWNWFLDRQPKSAIEPQERAHGDGLLVTTESPEAMEEVLWMGFFPELHEPERSNLLDASTAAPAFERFYRDHISKLLLVRGGRRYVSKGNYNIVRLGYLLKLFADARLVLPVRQPLGHIASLAKQHQRFVAVHATNPRALAHMQRVGHFEFGGDRRPINPGDDGAIRSIRELWQHGQEVRGLARYWALLYGFVAARLAAEPALRAATLVVRYEDLVGEPRTTLEQLFAHVRLEPPPGLIDRYARELRLPAYYQPAFSEADLAAIEEETGAVARRFGYPQAAHAA
jgi:hypothetical protein